MFAGPLFARELLIAPRDVRHFGLRAGYVAVLCILIYTGAQATFGMTPLRSTGDIAAFGAFIFNIICGVQLALVIGISLLLAAGSVAQEKDRRTLILLLMTDLRSGELVLGKSLASVLPVLVMIGVSFPALCFLRMLGGVTVSQILWVEAICLASALAATAWGTLVGYWREKTFQILSISLLGAGLFIGLAEVACVAAGPESTAGRIAAGCNPFRALASVLHPLAAQTATGVAQVQAWSATITLSLLALALWGYTCLRVRVWNPSRHLFVQQEETPKEAEAQDTARPTRAARPIWSTPVLWREICTQAYGRKVGLIKAAYFVFAVFCVLWLGALPQETSAIFGSISGIGVVFVILSLVSLVLVNAQSVTSLTSERDGQTLELLLVTEVTAKEFVFGKLGGVLFNTKEVIVAPLLFAIVATVRGDVSPANLVCIVLGYTVLVLFAAMLGLHAGLSFSASRAAILNSLGTILLLFVGVFVCMMLIVEARTSFILQLVPFSVFILGGSLALWTSLTHHNPSPALTLCAWGLPFLTFYSIVSFLLADTAAMSAAIIAAYGFTTIAMLVPAVSAFDLAMGRSTNDRA